MPDSTNSRDKTAAAGIVALTAVSASGFATAGAISRLLVRFGIPAPIGRVAAALGLSRPVPQPTPSRDVGPAMRETLAAERQFRAWYIVQASRRIQQAMREGVSMEEAHQREMVNFHAHIDASKNRIEQARKIDTLGKSQGMVLGWYAVMDSRTSTECRAANGSNFRIDERPVIGYPGTVHPHCRCRAGRRHRGAKMLASRRKAA